MPNGKVTVQRYRRAADYLAAAMIHLADNVLLHEPLRVEHLKPRLLGHWGTCPGVTYLYAGLNQMIMEHDAEVLLVTGPGHGAPANHANLWLEGTHADVDPRLSRDLSGLERLVTRFSWPGGFPSHLSPEVPGVIHEGGELGYALATAFGAAFDDPEVIVACLVGDGEAETGPTAGGWDAIKYLDPTVDGAVLPVLHLNGSKIASPTQSGTMSDEELVSLYRGHGWSPIVVDARCAYDDPGADALLAAALGRAHGEIRELQGAARSGRTPPRPAWPMVIMRSPKGWGVPDASEGLPLEGTFRSHQVPLPAVHDDAEQLALLEQWLRSYRPEELFDADGRPAPDLIACCPAGERRMGANPRANGGLRRADLVLPDLDGFATGMENPGRERVSPTEVVGSWLAAVMRASEKQRNFRIVCPDELESNKLGAVLEATDRAYQWPVDEYAEHLAPGGRVLEVLSEHNCQGWLQGYLLTGRHGLFPCYEAFASIVDSMVNQYAKFLKMSAEVPWRAPVASLNYLLTSEGWRQEHNGYSHQGSGFVNNVLTKKSAAARLYFPCDANSLLVTLRHCLAITDRINVVVAGKQPSLQWLSLEAAEAQFRVGAAVWGWASTDDGNEPEVVLACAGTVPTTETLAAARLLRDDLPDLRVRVVNVVDLFALAPAERHPHGMSAADFDDHFGADLPVVFNFHGYPSAVHEVLHGRPEPERFHVRGYVEEGTTTTPYDLLAANGVTRHDLAIEALRRVGPPGAEDVINSYATRRDGIRTEVRRTGTDPELVEAWTWADA